MFIAAGAEGVTPLLLAVFYAASSYSGTGITWIEHHILNLDCNFNYSDPIHLFGRTS